MPIISEAGRIVAEEEKNNKLTSISCGREETEIPKYRELSGCSGALQLVNVDKFWEIILPKQITERTDRKS